MVSVLGSASNSNSFSDKPSFSFPSMTPTVAGIAPLFLMIFPTLKAVLKLCGYGNPCVIIVDSKAITGLAFTIASLISSLRRIDLKKMLTMTSLDSFHWFSTIQTLPDPNYIHDKMLISLCNISYHLFSLKSVTECKYDLFYLVY